VTDRLIRIATALVVCAVAGIAAVISYRHAYSLAATHGESGLTALLVPLTVDGLIFAASMVILDASRRKQPVPPLAGWSLAVGIVATVAANVAHGWGHGLIGALVSAWPALALVGSYELLMLLVRAEQRTTSEPIANEAESQPAPAVEHYTPPAPADAPSLEQTVRARHQAGTSQRAIARQLNVDRRKVKRIIEQSV
jgi:uncharacterized membrane protein YhiD involved in acid resistance